MKININDYSLFKAMKFYTLLFLDSLEIKVDEIQFIGELSKWENNDIIYSMNIINSNGQTAIAPSIGFSTKEHMYLIFPTGYDLNIVREKYLKLDSDNNIIYDRQAFRNADIGKDIKVDLDLCIKDWINNTEEYIKFKNQGLID